MSRHPSSERFHEILKRVASTHDSKQADYGTDKDPFANVRAAEDFGIPAWHGAAIRMNDKMRRVQTYIKRGHLNHDSVEDDLLDLAVYAIIALVLKEEGG